MAPANEITDITPLANIPTLVNLDLSHNPITDANALFTLPNLKWLSLHATEVPVEQKLRLRKKVRIFYS